MSREQQICKVTIVGGVANAALLVFKFVAGILGNSAAMIADAVHSLSDFATDIIVLVFVSLSGKPADEDHDWGHGKYETLATTLIGIALLVVAALIICNGVVKLMLWIKGGELEEPGMLALWAALISIAVKEIIYRYTVFQGRKLDSQAVVANAWHHRSDALSSVGTALGIGAAALLGGRWAVLDPIAGVVVGFFIIKVGAELLKGGVSELMEASLPEETEKEILDIIDSFSDVSDPHHLRTRKVGSGIVIEVHVRMDGNVTLSESHERASRIERALKDRFGESTHVAVHMEPVK